MHFKNSADQKIFYQSWLVNQARAVIVIAHGLGEHSGRYQHIAEALNAENYSVYALDHQGHGQSEGKQGHVHAFSDYHTDLQQLVAMTKNENPNIPCHLLGHSMGGLIATGYALRHSDVDSLIVSAPAFGVPGKAANMQLKIGAFLGRFLSDTALSNKIDPAYVCSTQTVVDAYVNDPLVHDQITLGWGRALVAEQKYIHEHLHELHIPFLLLVPQCDKLTDHTVTENWFTLVPDGNKEMEIYPDSYHEVLNEAKEGPEAVQKIIHWLNELQT
ncbi:MAG: alpha/beta hydrolase [Gammaproteobacteria bacterium]|nr:alpha/beta hydrolase [Gammaproteobacteria bacterium]